MKDNLDTSGNNSEASSVASQSVQGSVSPVEQIIAAEESLNQDGSGIDYEKPNAENYNHSLYDNDDEEDDFVECNGCDGHDACRDFGCAIKAGIRINKDPFNWQ